MHERLLIDHGTPTEPMYIYHLPRLVRVSAMRIALPQPVAVAADTTSGSLLRTCYRQRTDQRDQLELHDVEVCAHARHSGRARPRKDIALEHRRL